MSVRHEYLGQVDRLCGSEILHASESLCRLLRYLAQQELENPGAHVKEYQIATEVYGRPSDFNPQVDSTIRVQAARLRSKLTDYYSSVGTHDAVVVELPRGSYSLQFRHRFAAGTETSAKAESNGTRSSSHGSAQRWGLAVSVLSFLVLLCLLAIVVLLRDRKPVQASSSSDLDPALKSFRVFWAPFLKHDDEPWVIFSNGEFIGRPETGLRYFDSKRDSKDQIWDHYTGVGEVLAVHELDQVFGELRQHIRVKRGSLFSLDDANNNDLIFVGSPSENLKLSELPTTREFVFQRLSEGARKGDLAIVNVHPRTSEQKTFVASPSGTPLTEDYALVALMPGINPARSVMVLAGTTTLGTQAAVEFVCRQNYLSGLLSQVAPSSAGVKPFEAVVHVKIGLGVPVGMNLAVVHARL